MQVQWHMFAALFNNAIFNIFKLISVATNGDEVLRMTFLVNIVRNMKLHFSNINGWSENFVTLVTESNNTCILASYISN